MFKDCDFSQDGRKWWKDELINKLKKEGGGRGGGEGGEKEKKKTFWNFDMTMGSEKEHQLIYICIYYSNCDNLRFPTFLIVDFYATESWMKTHHHNKPLASSVNCSPDFLTHRKCKDRSLCLLMLCLYISLRWVDEWSLCCSRLCLQKNGFCCFSSSDVCYKIPKILRKCSSI